MCCRPGALVSVSSLHALWTYGKGTYLGEMPSWATRGVLGFQMESLSLWLRFLYLYKLDPKGNVGHSLSELCPTPWHMSHCHPHTSQFLIGSNGCLEVDGALGVMFLVYHSEARWCSRQPEWGLGWDSLLARTPERWGQSNLFHNKAYLTWKQHADTHEKHKSMWEITCTWQLQEASWGNVTWQLPSRRRKWGW